MEIEKTNLREMVMSGPDGVRCRGVPVAEQRVVVERVGEGGLDVGVHAAALAPLGQRGPLQLGQVVYQLVPERQPHRVPYRQLRQLFHRRRGLVL